MTQTFFDLFIISFIFVNLFARKIINVINIGFSEMFNIVVNNTYFSGAFATSHPYYFDD